MNVNSQTILRLLGYILGYFQVYYLKFLKSIFLCKVENLGIDVQSYLHKNLNLDFWSLTMSLQTLHKTEPQFPNL